MLVPNRMAAVAHQCSVVGSGRAALLGLVCLLTGCAAPPFALTDESAMDALMVTRHVAELQQRHSMPLTCRIEGTDPDARRLYLGESHSDHTVRVGAYRVTSDGRVWVNTDPTLLEDRWAMIG
jgi:hypothetical protein